MAQPGAHPAVGRRPRYIGSGFRPGCHGDSVVPIRYSLRCSQLCAGCRHSTGGHKHHDLDLLQDQRVQQDNIKKTEMRTMEARKAFNTIRLVLLGDELERAGPRTPS